MQADQSISPVITLLCSGCLSNLSLPLSQETHKEYFVTTKEFACLLVTVLLFICRAHQTRKFQKKLQFPQVTWYRINLPLIFNGWCTVSQIGKNGMSVFTDCAKKYGKTFYLPFGPLNVIATADPLIIKKLLNSTSPHHLNKSGYIYKRLFVEELHDGLFVAKFSTWLSHRKCLSRGFTYKSFLSYMSIINEFSKDLTNDILNFSKEHKQPLRDGELFAKYLSTRLLRFTGDLITGPGTYSEQQISQIRKSILTHKDCLFYVFRHPHLFLRPLWRRHPMKGVSDRATRIMLAVMRKMIARYRSNRPEKDAIMQEKEIQDDRKFVPLIELMVRSEWSEKEILDNFATFVFAENEATFAAIQWTLFYLALHPDHQTICRKEVDALYKSKRAMNSTPQADMDIHFTIEDLSRIKYVERCVLESLRLCPPVPVFARRLGVPLKVNENLEIRSGQTIMVMPWVLHRDPDLYPDPSKFDPDRFHPENWRTRPAYDYLPFSAGRRNCLGWKLSQIQLKVCVAKLLRHFEISTKDKVDDVKLLYAVRVIPERNFNIIFTKRRDI